MSSRSRSWILYAPIATLLLVAVGWSMLWVYAKSRVDEEIVRWMAREAGQGRAVGCGERTIAGYPFRIEVDCRDAVLVDSRGAPRRYETPRVLAVAQLYKPNHIILEFAAPLRIGEPGPGGRDFARASWSLGRASIVTDGRETERVSVSLDRPEVTAAGAPTPYRAERAEFHFRRREAGGAAQPADLAWIVAKLDGPLGLPGISGPVDIEVQATATALDRLRGGDERERLRNWTQAGGRLDIRLARLLSPRASAEASGNVGLDPRGRADGNLRLVVAGLDQVIGDLVERRQVPREMMTMVPAMAAVSQPAEIAGKRAMALPVQLREGLIRVGPIPVGAIPPLF